MRANPAHVSEDPDLVRQLVRENPWATLVSQNGGELVASHYPVLLDEAADSLSILTHVGRPDDQIHGLGAGELLVIVQGHHGYVSPSWYAAGKRKVPTWNFGVAHCYGVPEILAEAENLEVLTRLVERFEREVEEPLLLDPDYGAAVAPGTVGLRIPIARFVCKRKLSQDKGPAIQRRVIEALRRPGPHHHPGLADEMEEAL